MTKKKIFITGSSGFIGKNILENLGNKYNFFAPSHKELDLLNYESVKKYLKFHGPFDVVLHTAIKGGNRKTGDSLENAIKSLRMFFNLASCDLYYKKFYYFGSAIEYAKEKPLINVRESEFGKHIPLSNWGFYKYICAKYAEENDKFINFRLFGVFGKYEDLQIRFISNAICKNIYDIPIVINQNIVMDYIFIDDFVKILDRFLNTKPKFRVYNITNGKPIDLMSVVKKINLISGKNVEIKIKHKNYANEYSGSNKRLMSEFKNVEFTNIDSAIEKLYRWYFLRRNKISKKLLLEDYF